MLTFYFFKGDILTGTCFVGILDTTGSLLVFVPLALYMSLGVLFLIMGLVSLVRIRSMINRDGITKTDKLEKLIGKIGKAFCINKFSKGNVMINTSFF